MIKTRIIGHRGAAGLALENTMASFQKAVDAGAMAIEFDVHATSDGHFVICHDRSTEQVSNTPLVIADTPLAELHAVKLHNGETVPLLTDVLDFARQHDITVIVEVKIATHLAQFCEVLDKYADLDMRVASFLNQTVKIIRKLRPELKCYLAEKRHPIRVMSKARSIGAVGIDLNYRLLNPLTYWLAKRYGMEIMVYTVNNRLIANSIWLLYPDVAICTNYPNRFLSHTKDNK